MKNIFKAKTFIFDNQNNNKISFWMHIKGRSENINFRNKIGVIFHNEPTSLLDKLECEVFDLEGKEIYVDNIFGAQENLGKRIFGFLSVRELIFMKIFNGQNVSILDK